MSEIRAYLAMVFVGSPLGRGVIGCAGRCVAAAAHSFVVVPR